MRDDCARNERKFDYHEKLLHVASALTKQLILPIVMLLRLILLLTSAIVGVYSSQKFYGEVVIIVLRHLGNNRVI